MNQRRLLRAGIGGALVTALCCFTPVLVLVLGALGLSAALAWLDFVLIPLLLLFLAITGYASWQLYKARSSRGPC